MSFVNRFEILCYGDGNADALRPEGERAECRIEDIIGVFDFGDARVFATIAFPFVFWGN